MGHFTVPCGISGLPIRCGQPIIGFFVEEHRHESYFKYVPISIPVTGEYDDYGGIDTENDKNLRNDKHALVLCHLPLWNFLVSMKEEDEGYVDPNRKHVSMLEFFHICREEFVKEVDMYAKLAKGAGESATHWKERLADVNQIADSVMFHQSGYKLRGLFSYYTREFFNSKSGAMKDFFISRIVKNVFPSKKECKLMEELSKVYGSTFFRGRQITPTTHCYTIQDTDYKRETAWMREVAKYATKLKKN